MRRNANLWTPLDCAAAKGWVEAATVLLDADCPVDPTDKAKVREERGCLFLYVCKERFSDCRKTSIKVIISLQSEREPTVR